MYTSALLNIRFSASLPDLALTIEDPQSTSVLTLIRTVRDQLPSPHNSMRLRLIYSGRVLISESSLVEALRLQPDPSSSAPKSNPAKGKAPIKPPPTPSTERRYIHATFSDALTAEALDKERKDALAADAALTAAAANNSTSSRDKTDPSKSNNLNTNIQQSRRRSSHSGRSHYGHVSTSSGPTSPATQMPQGFDRLLSAGLSAVEVASLRSQFSAILAHTHTPDTMPNAYELRELEERWLDNDGDGAGLGGAGLDGRPGAGGLNEGAGGLFGRLGGGGNVGDEDSSGLDDMLWGNLMGFFWPIGAVVWLLREDGVWTQRRKIAVATGALVNLAFSIMRAAS